MRLFTSGFNLYGQFVKFPTLTINGFIDHSYEKVNHFEFGHTFSAIVEDDQLQLHGYKNGKTHQIQNIHFQNCSYIKQMQCTEKRIVILNQSGVLHKVDLSNNQIKVDPLLGVTADEGDAFMLIACGSKINVAITKNGHVFSLPSKLNFVNKNIVYVSAGREHCIVLDSDGNVYTFGRGSRGQLGHGCLEDEPEPKLVQGLAGLKIAKIAAGGWHCCALSAEGDLYVWGWNQNGQLGLNKENEVSVMALPHVVDFPDAQNKENLLELKVVEVACGSRHTVCLLENGHLYGTGWNKYKQLGSIECDDENLHTMTFLHNFTNTQVTALKCAPWSTAIFTQ